MENKLFIKNKIVYGIGGLVFGVIASPFVWIVACFVCDGSAEFMGSFWFSVIVCFIVGIITGHTMDKEEQSKAIRAEHQLREQARRQLEYEEEQRRKQQETSEHNALDRWKSQKLLPLLNSFLSIPMTIDQKGIDSGKYNTHPIYDQQKVKKLTEQLESLKKQAIDLTRECEFVSYKKCFDEEYRKCVEALDGEVHSAFHRGDFAVDLWKTIYYLFFITQDKQYLNPALAVYHFTCGTFESITNVSLENYGNLKVPFEIDAEMESFSSNIVDIQSKVEQGAYQSGISLSNDKYFANIEKILYPEITIDAEKLMWYYARKKPFDTKNFEKACRIYRRFVGKDSLIEMIVKIFSKKEIGGEQMVESDKKEILAWVESKRSGSDNIAAQCIASALAWMELYRLELSVLQQLVQQKVQLEENVQERLKFLSEGGASNIKVYDIPVSKDFLFDNSSKDWDEKGISICFRNMKMKRIEPHYSLLLESWAKTIPLTSGQKFSREKLYQNFEMMLDDFDGEVTCKPVKAKAVNLPIEYADAMLFQFTTERNRCISMLFHYEKFGRNLNITILTFFTPEIGLSFENMEKYAIAIKSNMYVKGFSESILQEVDKVLKEEVPIYDDEDAIPKKKNLFE